MKRLLKSMLSNSTRLARPAVDARPPAVRSIDSTLKIGTTLARSGMCALARTAPGSDRLAAEAALLALIGIAGGAPEVVGQLAGDPVGAAGAERRGRAHRVEAADRLVGRAPVLARQA